MTSESHCVLSGRLRNSFWKKEYGANSDKRGEDYLSRVVNSSDRLGKMIDQMLILAQTGFAPIQQARVSIREVIAEIKEDFSAILMESGAEVHLEASCPDVLGDPLRVRQIFANLIGNAINYNESPMPVINIGVDEQEASTVTFYVRDNGIGIPAEYHKRIFDVFHRGNADRAPGCRMRRGIHRVASGSLPQAGHDDGSLRS